MSILNTLKQYFKDYPSLEQQTVDAPWQRHKIVIGDGTLYFSVPHNFSPNYPVLPLPGNVQYKESDFQGDSVKGKNIWRAWWDYRTPGKYNRYIGSMMLTIDLVKVHPEYKRDIYIKDHFIEALQINTVNMYARLNQKAFSKGPQSRVTYAMHPCKYSIRSNDKSLPEQAAREKIQEKDRIGQLLHNRDHHKLNINKPIWLISGSGDKKQVNNYVHYNTPIDNNTYLAIGFNTFRSESPVNYTPTARRVMGIIMARSMDGTK